MATEKSQVLSSLRRLSGAMSDRICPPLPWATRNMKNYTPKNTIGAFCTWRFEYGVYSQEYLPTCTVQIIDKFSIHVGKYLQSPWFQWSYDLDQEMEGSTTRWGVETAAIGKDEIESRHHGTCGQTGVRFGSRCGCCVLSPSFFSTHKSESNGLKK